MYYRWAKVGSLYELTVNDKVLARVGREILPDGWCVRWTREFTDDAPKIAWVTPEWFGSLGEAKMEVEMKCVPFEMR